MLQGLQRRVGVIALIVLLCGTMPNEATATAVASSANFTVLAPTQRLADMVVGHADAFRSQIAKEWLGGDLPPALHPAAISIEIDATRSFARTLIDANDGRHLVWLVGSEQAVTEYLLQHEVAHVVLAARYGDSMPAWANEGIASRYDNPRRHQIRQQQLAGFVSIDSWPHLDRLLDEPIRQPWDYAAAVSLTNYLDELGGREKFLDFVRCGSERGWPIALRTHYGLDSVADLEYEWHRSVRACFAEPAISARLSPARVSARWTR
ncbi:MAG: hypothetical protein ACR2NU_01740 [Aeoliella sp.]